MQMRGRDMKREDGLGRPASDEDLIECRPGPRVALTAFIINHGIINDDA